MFSHIKAFISVVYILQEQMKVDNMKENVIKVGQEVQGAGVGPQDYEEKT